MRQRNLLARLFRALSGDSQKEFAERTGVHATLLAQYELDQVEPGLDHLERLADGTGLTIESGERILEFAGSLRQARIRGGLGIEDLADQVALLVSSVYEHVVLMPLPEVGDLWLGEQDAGDLWSRLKPLSDEDRLMVVRSAPEFQIWALAERICGESVVQASRDVERAASLARLAQEVAERVKGTDGWRSRIQGYAAVHTANALRAAGDLKQAAAVFEEGKRLWENGTDPDHLLDPGRLLDLEAALRRDQEGTAEA